MLPLRRRMVARDLGEPHRVSSPLELLFDLTFVAAVSQVAGRLAHATEGAHAGDSIAPFLMVFFASGGRMNSRTRSSRPRNGPPGLPELAVFVRFQGWYGVVCYRLLTRVTWA